MKHDYFKLNVWQKARELNKEIYKTTTSFPEIEKYGITSQIRRASISILSNIAEGSGYESNVQFSRFLKISIGSLCEVEAQMYVSLDLDLITKEEFDSLLNLSDEVKRMLLGHLKKIEKD